MDTRAKRTANLKDQSTNAEVPSGASPYVYRVAVERDEDRYHAEIPTLPGCYSWVYTFEEALKNIKEALELWLEVKREEGERIPVEDAQTIRTATLNDRCDGVIDQLKNVTAREWVRALEREGFTTRQTKGSHHVYQHVGWRQGLCGVSQPR
jgi:predicted RNase H-like HicB family nuclease